MPLVGFPPYAEKCRQVVAQGYQGFILSYFQPSQDAEVTVSVYGMQGQLICPLELGMEW